MLKLKNILPVFVVLLFLGVASTAFAQVSCSVASTPVSRDTSTGLTEPAGDITFTCTQTGVANTAATITVDYQGAPITNCQVGGTQNATCTATGYPAAKPIAAISSASNPAGCGAPTIGATNVVNVGGQVVLSVPPLNPGAGLSCSFTLTGVLFAFAGTGKTSDTATVSVSPGNGLLITAGQNSPTIVTSVLDAIASSGYKLSIAGPAVVLTTGFVVSSQSVTNLTENYIDAFRSAPQFNSGASSQGVQFNYTFAGIPTGSSETCVPSANNGNAVSIVSPANGILTAALPTLVVEWTSGGTTGLTTIDTLTMTCNFATGTAATPLTPANITQTVTLAPVGTAFGAANAVLTNPATTGQIPRYTGPTLGPLTVTTIIAATSHILYPFITAGGGFDTGLAVANTGADPYGSKGLSGPVTVVFFPQGTGTPFCVATGAGAAGTTGGTVLPGFSSGCTVMTTVPGSGIIGGNLNAGSTWAVNTSDLLKAGGAPASFTGYAFAISNSPLNHGTFFVYLASGGNFAGFSGGPALLVSNPFLPGNARSLLFEGLAH
jgi:hypothetical protein